MESRFARKLGALFFWVLLSAAARAESSADPSAPVALRTPVITDCDRLASSKDDRASIAPGVDFGAINGPAALAACDAALKQYPDEPRLSFIRGRALTRLGRFPEAMSAIRAASDKGYAAAISAVGFSYFIGKGVPRDPAEGIRLIKLAAERGDPPAMFNLALLEDDGNGLPANSHEAALWMAEALEARYPTALQEMIQNYRARTSTFRAVMQGILLGKGLYAGPTSGIFDAATLAAIRTLGGQ